MKEKAFIISAKTFDGQEKKTPLFVPLPEAGVDMPSYEDLAAVGDRIAITEKRITNLEKGVAADSFETDDSVAYVKSVPANSAPYAAISKVGGMTHRVNVGTEEAPVYELRNAAVTEFVIKGANLLRFKERTVTANGITFAGNSDGTITVNGTATANAYFDFVEIISLDETDTGYLLDGCPAGGSDVKYAIQLYHTKDDGSSGQLIMSEFGSGQPFTIAYKKIKGMLVVRNGTTVTDLVFKPRIVDRSKKDMPFRKAFCTNYPLPAEVQALEGYGWGSTEAVHNYVDMGNRKFVKHTNVVDLSTLSWSRIASVGRWVASVPNLRNSYTCLVCENYTPTRFENMAENCISVTADVKVTVKIADDTVKPTGLLYYGLATPEIIDISDILSADNLIEVEGGGTITFENEHGLAVPSEVVYQMKGASE